MSGIFIFFVIVLVVAQVTLPTQYGFFPLVIAGLSLGNVEVLPELTPVRLLIIVGLGRAIIGGFFVWSRRCHTDVICLVFVICALISTIGHSADAYTPSPLSARIGLCLNVGGVYLYGRAYLQNLADLRRYALLLCIALIPLAIGMALEKRTGRNLYKPLGARSEFSTTREGKIRAQGPFRISILAGTVGAASLPLAYMIFKLRNRIYGSVGIGACLLIVMSSSSSGPMAAAGAGIGFLALWRKRHLTWKIVWGIIGISLLYTLFSGRRPWFLMAQMDLVGGSTGWHRAYLIDQGLRFFSEWWLWGTDYTRHWMPTGVSFSPTHTDITNYYLHLGVIGGLPVVLCLIGFIRYALRDLRQMMQKYEFEVKNLETVFALWTVGSAIGVHAISFVSISYFDQMFVFFYILVGAVPGLVENLNKLHEDNKIAK